MSASARLAVTGVMLLIFAGMVTMSLEYPPASRFLPLVVGLPGLALCVLQLAIDIVALRRANGTEADPEQAANIRVAAILFTWLAVFLAVILLLGFLIATPILLFAFLRFYQRESVVMSAALATGGLLTMWLVFDVLLSLPLHGGFLMEWISY